MKKFARGFVRNFALILLAATGYQLFKSENWLLFGLCVVGFFILVGITLRNRNQNEQD